MIFKQNYQHCGWQHRQRLLSSSLVAWGLILSSNGSRQAWILSASSTQYLLLMLSRCLLCRQQLLALLGHRHGPLTLIILSIINLWQPIRQSMMAIPHSMLPSLMIRCSLSTMQLPSLGVRMQRRCVWFWQKVIFRQQEGC